MDKISDGLVHLAITFGDAASIGPEVAEKALIAFFKKPLFKKNCKVHAFAPKQFLRRALLDLSDRGLVCYHYDLEEDFPVFKAGHPSKLSAERALKDLDLATEECSKGECAALVTGPVDKALCAQVNPKFHGHTEYLQKKTRSQGSTMLLASQELKVALVTTHIPVRDISKKLKTKNIVATCMRLHEFLLQLNGKKPRLAVCALNPHASDGGLFGNEEAKIIAPAIRECKRLDMNVEGPFPSDALFHRAAKDFEAVVCMYHDQGLIPLKMTHFYDAVNITLGLPFLRVSVDHGTAFDIAGKRKASHLSYEHALEFAFNHVRSRQLADQKNRRA